ncbi:protein kinase 4 [Drosophila albomicans]|uniref:Protein kinase 4 n=1 Tax=Drosophila albomicans TaxID=7291 RepID=A0A9C6WDS8_DROAB|nr:protein kinase 4 [Drosophila albomicans]
MERNNGRYPYIRRQGSGNGPHNHHHHNSSNSSSTSSSSSSASVTNASHNTQYSNNSIINSSSNTNALYAAAVSQQQHQQQQHQQSVTISQHDELIRYIRGAWNKVSEQGTPVIYCNESDNQLKNFKPFNLEEYWGQRLVQNIHVTTTHQ